MPAAPATLGHPDAPDAPEAPAKVASVVSDGAVDPSPERSRLDAETDEPHPHADRRPRRPRHTTRAPRTGSSRHTTARREDSGRHGRLGRVGVALGTLLVVGLAGTAAVVLWTRVADARSAVEKAREADARTLHHDAPGSTGASEAGGATDGAGGPGEVLVAGDSLTATATYLHGAGEAAPRGAQLVAWQGWTAADAEPSIRAAVAADRVDTLVVALGTNDSAWTWGNDGWDTTDVERFRRLLATPDDDACVVLVLPGYGWGIDPAHAAEMDEARMDMLRLADERAQRGTGMPGAGRTVVVDWQATVDARPELVGPDGIHLASDPASGLVATEAATARTDLYWDGVAQCRTP